jgi:acyl carrier protein
VKEAIKQIFIDELGVDGDQYADDLKYNSIPEWDSASHMVVVTAIEEKFELELDSDEIIAMTSIAKIYQVLQKRGVALD